MLEIVLVIIVAITMEGCAGDGCVDNDARDDGW